MSLFIEPNKKWHLLFVLSHGGLEYYILKFKHLRSVSEIDKKKAFMHTMHILCIEIEYFIVTFFIVTFEQFIFLLNKSNFFQGKKPFCPQIFEKLFVDIAFV